MIHFTLLVVCAVAIYFSCEWFVNAVEWLGRRLRVGPLAVGTILAAFGTALPESVVTFVAVVFGAGDEQKDLGVGAAMGGPLALATIAYGVTGLVLLARHRRLAAATRAGSTDRAAAATATTATTVAVGGPGTIAHPRSHREPDGPGSSNGLGGVSSLGGLGGTEEAGGSPDGPVDETVRYGDLGKLARDQRCFMAIFVVKVALGLVAFAIKPWLGLVFFAAYAVYFVRELRGGSNSDDAHDDELEPLRLQRGRAEPATWAVITQTFASLAIIFVASQLFVHQLDAIGPMLGLPAAVTALLLSPVATELPEVMNAVIWIRQGKTALALANISGAMMIQATVPSGLGLLFTSWEFDNALLVSGVVTMAAIGYLLLLLRSGRFRAGTLAWATGFYLLFAVALVPILR